MRQWLREQLGVPDGGGGSFKRIGVQAHVDHSDMLSASSKQADILIAGINFKTQFDTFKLFPNKIYLKSLVNRQEIREKLQKVLQENNWL